MIKRKSYIGPVKALRAFGIRGGYVVHIPGDPFRFSKKISQGNYLCELSLLFGKKKMRAHQIPAAPKRIAQNGSPVSASNAAHPSRIAVIRPRIQIGL